MPAALPHKRRADPARSHGLLGGLLQDSRLRIVEVAEYAALRDQDQRCVNALIDILVAGLKPS